MQLTPGASCRIGSPQQRNPKAGIIPLDHQAVVSYEGDDLMERKSINEIIALVRTWNTAR
jgi:hypothetical protein